MEIIFNKDIELFKGKTRIDIKNKLPFFRKHFKEIFKSYLNEVCVDEQNIKSVRFVHNAPNSDLVKKIVENNKLYFSIEISDELLPYLYVNPSTLDEEKAKAVFQHELFHCKDFLTIYNDDLSFHHSPLSDSFRINTTYNYLYDEGISIWSEFYSFYQNYKINPIYEVYDICDDIANVEKWIKAIQVWRLTNQNKDTINLAAEMLSDAHRFWYHMVSLTAIYVPVKQNCNTTV